MGAGQEPHTMGMPATFRGQGLGPSMVNFLGDFADADRFRQCALSPFIFDEYGNKTNALCQKPVGARYIRTFFNIREQISQGSYT